MNELTQEQIQILNELGCDNEAILVGLLLGLTFEQMYASALEAQYEPDE